MRKFRMQVFLGLFVSSFFFRFGFCILLFIAGLLLSGVSMTFFRIGLACLLLDFVVSLIDAVRCMSAIKGKTGDPQLDEFVRVIFNDKTDTPYTDLDKAMEALTGLPNRTYDLPDNKYLPLANQMKEKIHERIKTAEAAEVFREAAEGSGFEDETIIFHSWVGKRYADGKKYFIMQYKLYSDGYTLSFDMLYKHVFSDPNTILEVICDAGREAFYQEVSDHQRFQKRKDEVPLHIDVVCGEGTPDENNEGM